MASGLAALATASEVRGAVPPSCKSSPSATSKDQLTVETSSLQSMNLPASVSLSCWSGNSPIDSSSVAVQVSSHLKACGLHLRGIHGVTVSRLICCLFVLLVSFAGLPSEMYSGSNSEALLAHVGPPKTSHLFPHVTGAAGQAFHDDLEKSIGAAIFNKVKSSVVKSAQKLGKEIADTTKKTAQFAYDESVGRVVSSVDYTVKSAFSGTLFDTRRILPANLISAWGTTGTGSALFLQAADTRDEAWRVDAIRTVRAQEQYIELFKLYDGFWSEWVDIHMDDTTFERASAYLEGYTYELLQLKTIWSRPDIARDHLESTYARIDYYKSDFDTRFFKPYMVKLVAALNSRDPFPVVRGHAERVLPRMRVVVLTFIQACGNHPRRKAGQECLRTILDWHAQISAFESPLLKASSSLLPTQNQEMVMVEELPEKHHPGDYLDAP
eukprot:GHVT01002977.1.p1 GENE.GHVT01002977.1~~GHVT01002977.1.p1  ORF type:complete len:440 (+),score=43.26 GHVT01002977.1:374-1693(+)